jgi:penicillin amidase
VPGDGRYEWDGFHDMDELPSMRDPEQGWFATANQLNLPDGHPVTVTYDWYAPYRHQRIVERLGERVGWTVEDCVKLQTDHVSVPAQRILPLLDDLGDDPSVAAALDLLKGWNAELSKDSAAAALFEVWYRRHLRPALLEAELKKHLPGEQIARALTRVLPLEGLSADARVDLRLAATAPKELVRSTLKDAVTETERLLGDDMTTWAWGRLHHAEPKHPLAFLLGDEAPSAGPAPRGGSGDTVGATTYTPDFRQTAGATFRLVVDVGSWDDSVAMNSPGQSGVPTSPHHHDLFESWAADEAFPLLYSREAVEKNLGERLLLTPP